MQDEKMHFSGKYLIPEDDDGKQDAGQFAVTYLKDVQEDGKGHHVTQYDVIEKPSNDQEMMYDNDNQLSFDPKNNVVQNQDAIDASQAA